MRALILLLLIASASASSCAHTPQVVSFPRCKIPAFPVIPDIQVTLTDCPKGFVCMPTPSAVDLAGWLEKVEAYREMLGVCPALDIEGAGIELIPTPVIPTKAPAGSESV